MQNFFASSALLLLLRPDELSHHGQPIAQKHNQNSIEKSALFIIFAKNQTRIRLPSFFTENKRILLEKLVHKHMHALSLKIVESKVKLFYSGKIRFVSCLALLFLSPLHLKMIVRESGTYYDPLF